MATYQLFPITCQRGLSGDALTGHLRLGSGLRSCELRPVSLCSLS